MFNPASGDQTLSMPRKSPYLFHSRGKTQQMLEFIAFSTNSDATITNLITQTKKAARRPP